MKRSRLVLGVAFVSSVFLLVGCGQGTYRIPAVEPVVKPKPGNDLLDDISAGDEEKPASSESKPSSSPPPAEKEKAPESKAPEAPKSEPVKPAEPAKGEPPKAEKTPEKATAKPAATKPASKSKEKK
jgi:hypothetical protein